MKKIISLAITLFAACTLSAQVTQVFEVSSFNGIQASSAFKISVSKGKTESVIIEADEDIMPYVRAEVNNGKLKLYIDKNNVRNLQTLNAIIQVKDLNSVRLSGACSLVGSDVFDADKFVINVSGASKLDLALRANVLSASASGASDIDVRAEAAVSELGASGASKLIVKILNGKKASISATGSSSVKASGDCESAGYKVSGASSVGAFELKTKSSQVSVSGSSSLKLFASDEINGHVSGAGSVRYDGRPAIKVKQSGAGKISSR